jgi:hypothetical protein
VPCWPAANSGTPPGSRTVTATGRHDLGASIRFHLESSGTQVKVTMSNAPAGYVCTLTAVGKDGSVEVGPPGPAARTAAA